jgi:hypothetical protein
MTIQTNIPVDSAVQTDTRQTAQQRGDNSSSLNDQSPAAQALNAFSLEETDGPGALDSTGADQLMQGLLQSLSGDFNSAVSAHAGLSANSAFELIQ